MRVRSYLVILIVIVALGACALVGGLALSYQDLEKEREKQALSMKALESLKYVKEDLARLTTTGDLIFGATNGLNSYLAKPANAQINQIEKRIKAVQSKVLVPTDQTQALYQTLDQLKTLFKEISKGETKGDEYDRYDQLSFGAVRAFHVLFKASKSIASQDTQSLERQQEKLRTATWILSFCYLIMIILLTWWSTRSISKPVAKLSLAAESALDGESAFQPTHSGPRELRALGAVLYRLIHQLESEVAIKTIDLEQENKERRSAEAQLRILNERQRALVEASVRFVPRPFLEFLGRSDLTLVERGDSTRQHLGILFSDLRGFTSLAETREPQEIFDLLNRYLDAVVPSIHDNYGFVDKYIGDAIMALFPGKAERAVQAGVDMFHQLYKFVERDQVSLKMGVGIHWGEVVLGTLGSEERWESTVIGDTVNLAARLEGMTKAYECPLIISETLAFALPAEHAFTLRPLDLVRVKGRNAPVTIYEVLDAHQENIKALRSLTLESTLAGFEAYKHGSFEKAISYFQSAEDMQTGDPLPKLFIERCNTLLQAEPTEWTGVYTHTSK